LRPLEQRLASLGEKRELACRIASAVVTLLRSEPRLFPIREGQRVAVISAEPSLVAALAQRLPKMLSLTVSAFPADKTREELKKQARALSENADVAAQLHHESRVVLASYSYREAATEAAAAALLGEPGTPGRLPVTLPSVPCGHGLDPFGRRVAEVKRLSAIKRPPNAP
jgi:beta-N-acetylhexosaminidase